MNMDVIPYAIGLMHASVCVNNSVPDEKMLAVMNTLHHPGTSLGWMLSEDETFAGGEPNPCPCDKFDDRRHLLLVC